MTSQVIPTKSVQIKTMNRFAFFILLTVMSVQARSKELPLSVTAADLQTEKSVSITSGKKGMVIVFLSASCPCSNSHVEELKKLALEHRDFNFVGVHSNQDEKIQDSRTYFKKVDLPFIVLEDKNAMIAEKFGALKTPHAFVVTPEGQTAYKGGVTSSAQLADAEHFFLREALEDIEIGRNVRTSEGRTLGCAIERGG